MLNNKGNTTCRGDIGLFRGALLLSGFCDRAETIIFNDDNKDHTTRRLKLWGGDAIFNAPQEQQRELEYWLREAFGDRILCMYFIEGYNWREVFKSLCIKLKD